MAGDCRRAFDRYGDAGKAPRVKKVAESAKFLYQDKAIVTFADLIQSAAGWANNNPGVVAIILAALPVIAAVIRALRSKPKFKVRLLPGPTYCCTFLVGEKHDGFDVHRTGIALYLEVTNKGSKASSIGQISVGYHWCLKPFSWNWFRYSIGWSWIEHQHVIAADFQVGIGDNIKVYPFLTQRSTILAGGVNTFLEPGKSTNGVVFFEDAYSYGGRFPKAKSGKTTLKICIRDVFGRSHCGTFKVPVVSFVEARDFNPAFGEIVKKAAVAKSHPAEMPIAGLYPYGIPVFGRHGFVRSPYSPDKITDVRGYSPGTEVKDPYTGQIFLVP